MRHHVLQDFVTIRGGSNVTTISQSESGWIDVGPYENLIAWIDCREASFTAGATYAIFALQTAPIKDEYLFVNMEINPLTLAAGTTVPKVRTIAMQQLALATATVSVPLGKFLRWQLVAPGNTGTFDATFRIVVCVSGIAEHREHRMTHAMYGGG